MEIVKFKKGKKNIYELELDNGLSLKFYDDVIVKYNLLVNKKFDDQKLKDVTDYNDSLGAYYESLKKLSTKLRSELELRNMLEKKDYSRETIDKTIAKLKKDGYLNRKLYIKSYINDVYRFNNYGPDKIRNNLNKLGFKNEEIDDYLDLDFKEKAIKIIDKKVKTNKKLSNYMLKQNISNYLINLGYRREDFIDYLQNIEIDNQEQLKKDADILLKKYSKKYENDKILYLIKDKLYKKGYNREEIGEVLNELL